jgi:hypothetical protein
MSKITELASGQLNGTASITIELVEADETPAVVIIRLWAHRRGSGVVVIPSRGFGESAGWGYDTLCHNWCGRRRAAAANQLAQLNDEGKQSGKPCADEPFMRCERRGKESPLQRRQLSREKNERNGDETDAYRLEDR